MLKMPQMEWQNSVTEKVKGMLVTNPGMAPSAVRVDQLDREQVKMLLNEITVVGFTCI
jgi:hypothetical protein